MHLPLLMASLLSRHTQPREHLLAQSLSGKQNWEHFAQSAHFVPSGQDLTVKRKTNAKGIHFPFYSISPPYPFPFPFISFPISFIFLVLPLFCLFFMSFSISSPLIYLSLCFFFIFLNLFPFPFI